MALALEEQALVLYPVVEVVEHVIRGRHDQPFALADIHLLELVVIIYLALLLAWRPYFLLPVLDSLNDRVSKEVDLGRYAIGLLENLYLTLAGQEAFHVSTGPRVYRLVIISCDERAVRLLRQSHNQFPLQAG